MLVKNIIVNEEKSSIVLEMRDTDGNYFNADFTIDKKANIPNVGNAYNVKREVGHCECGDVGDYECRFCGKLLCGDCRDDLQLTPDNSSYIVSCGCHSSDTITQS